MRKRLTVKQQRFVEEYLIELNATQAAIRAGYSRRTARQIGEENLTKPDIAKCIREVLEQRRNQCQVKGDALVEELQKVAFSDIRQAFTTDLHGRVRLKTITEIPEGTARGIASIRSVTCEHKDGRITRRTSVRMHDKFTALSLLAKHLGYLPS